MLITKPGVLAIILMTSACASNAGEWRPPKAPKEPLRGGVAELQVTAYDGETITGRLLLDATIDPLTIDGRFNESANVDIDMRTLRACGKKDFVPHIDFDIFPSPPRPDEIIIIRPGYWYGGNISYRLFDKKATGLGPECLEAELVVRALHGGEAARIPIHVVRTDKPPPPPEGGAPAEPKPPASDAGAR